MSSQQPQRDPAAPATYYEDFFSTAEYIAASLKEEFASLAPQYQYKTMISVLSDSADYVVRQYGRGDSLETLVHSVPVRLAEITAATAFLKRAAPALGESADDIGPIKGCWRSDYQFAALVLLLAASSEEIEQLRQLITQLDKERNYLFDLLFKSFAPTHQLARKYKANKYCAAWTLPLVAVLSMPASQRAEALAAHMKNWNRLMRPYWAFGEQYLRCEFAFEVALAVCAYDIDDSAFSDHPYYPRDLVNYYRTNLRDSRDGWRARDAGAGVAVEAPPPPQKADLTKSKRKGLPRWVELVCDGDADAIESVLETVGKARTVKDLDTLMEALSENSQAIQADIKDDTTLGLQADALAGKRGLGGFEAPAGPPFGPSRCSTTLREFATWVAPHGYQLVDLDGEDDAWHAVLVQAQFHAELLALCQTVGMRARDPLAA